MSTSGGQVEKGLETEVLIRKMARTGSVHPGDQPLEDTVDTCGNSGAPEGKIRANG